MASIVDELFCRSGWIDHEHRGVTSAKAGDQCWYREPGETETRFLSRICREATAFGYRVATIGGHLQVDEPPRVAADIVRLIREDGPSPGWK